MIQRFGSRSKPMGKRARLNTQDVLPVMRHLADVASLKAEPMVQRQFFMDGLHRLAGTDSSFFYIANDWRVGGAPHFAHISLSSDHEPLHALHMTRYGSEIPMEDDPFVYASLRDYSAVPAWTHRDALRHRNPAKQHPYFMDLCHSARLCDGVVSLFRTSPNHQRIVGVGMHRTGRTRRMLGKEAALIRFAIGELRQLVAVGHFTLPPLGMANKVLPPRLRQTLELVLTGESPKAMARKLGLSIHTVREHIDRLYVAYGVRGRDELMARFIPKTTPDLTP